ncbi:MAG: TVP38/TMEM64 family protein, partial [Nitrospirota bacterium]|nr:TVP38/TMEM64 family protein [Nitrospirota bacterium]
SVLCYIVIYISTAFFIPGAIPLTIAGGFLFNVFWGTVYVCIGATTGATLAFFSAKYLIGNWIQDRYQNQLKRFNEEISKNGCYYLLTLRVIPVFPFFLVNYLAGLTKVPLRIYLLTLIVTVLPGSVLYTFAGQQLGTIESIEDIYSVKILIAFLLLIFFAFSPIVLKYMKGIKSKIKGRS